MIEAIAYDTGVPSLASSAFIHVTVDDVNDHEPRIVYTTGEKDNLVKVR